MFIRLGKAKLFLAHLHLMVITYLTFKDSFQSRNKSRKKFALHNFNTINEQTNGVISTDRQIASPKPPFQFVCKGLNTNNLITISTVYYQESSSLSWTWSSWEPTSSSIASWIALADCFLALTKTQEHRTSC